MQNHYDRSRVMLVYLKRDHYQFFPLRMQNHYERRRVMLLYLKRDHYQLLQLMHSSTFKQAKTLADSLNELRVTKKFIKEITNSVTRRYFISQKS